MKKKLLLGFALLVSGLGMAQESGAVTAYLEGDIALKAGLSIEFSANKKLLKRNYSEVLQLGYARATATKNGFDFNSNGLSGAYGVKWYLSKTKQFYGWNIQDMVDITSVWFKDANYDGKMMYFSFINPVIGYKFKVNHFTIEPQAGFSWNIKTKGTGDVSNTDFPNTTLKFGIRIGYMD